MTAQHAALITSENENKQLAELLTLIYAYSYMGVSELMVKEELTAQTQSSLKNLGYEVIAGKDVSDIRWTEKHNN